MRSVESVSVHVDGEVGRVSVVHYTVTHCSHTESQSLGGVGGAVYEARAPLLVLLRARDTAGRRRRVLVAAAVGHERLARLPRLPPLSPLPPLARHEHVRRVRVRVVRQRRHVFCLRVETAAFM